MRLRLCLVALYECIMRSCYVCSYDWFTQRRFWSSYLIAVSKISQTVDVLHE